MLFPRYDYEPLRKFNDKLREFTNYRRHTTLSPIYEFLFVVWYKLIFLGLLRQKRFKDFVLEHYNEYRNRNAIEVPEQP